MKNSATALLFGTLLLFFVQQVTYLVESIYMLNLLNTRMDARALGILFFFSPLFLLFFRKTIPNWLLYGPAISFLAAQALSPWVSTNACILTSGIAVCAFLLFLGLVLTTSKSKEIPWLLSFVITALLSLFFRTMGLTQDSLIAGPAPFAHFVFTIFTAVLLVRFLSGKNDPHKPDVNPHNSGRLFLSASGFFCTLALYYFIFSSPTVLTRWTESSYALIISFYAIALSVFFIIFILSPSFFSKLKKSHLLLWNILFIVAVLLAILLHTVEFPENPQSAVVVVQKSSPIDLAALLAVILSPILFINLSLFASSLQNAKTSRLAWPLVLGCLFFVVLIFILIFTTVWGYVGDVSRWFRNKFYLPFLLAGLGMLLPILFSRNLAVDERAFLHKKFWIAVVVIMSSIIVTIAVRLDGLRIITPDKIDQLTIMSYNIQQGVDIAGTKNYEKQCALIKKVNPDILCLQESDVARLSGGNSDVVRYFAQRLKYHSYYGPKTVTGTFGTAILSRFPLQQCRTIFSFSDVDEIGTSVVEIRINGHHVVVFNSHPAGSSAAKHAHVDALLESLKSCDYVIAAGDYNFREGSPYYEKLTAFLQDSWRTRWPTDDGDMGTVEKSYAQCDDAVTIDGWENNVVLDIKNRIDFIFLSRNFDVINSIYLPVPDSQSDHPAHWAIIRFAE